MRKGTPYNHQSYNTELCTLLLKTHATKISFSPNEFKNTREIISLTVLKNTHELVVNSLQTQLSENHERNPTFSDNTS